MSNPPMMSGDPAPAKIEFAIYEVFTQKDHNSPHVHVGSVDAGSPDDALLLAKENFLRRDPCVNIWVVRKENVHATSYEDADFFARERDISYRLISGYKSNAEKWRRYMQKPLTIEDFTKE